MAPEILNVEEYDNKSDLWSLVIIIYQLFFKYSPYDAQTQIGLLKKIKSLGKAKLKKTMVYLLDDLIGKLLEDDPNKRLSWKEYFEHPFLKNDIK